LGAYRSAQRQFGAGVLRPKLPQPSFDIVQVMERVVQRMFEKSPDRVAVVANGDPTPPNVRASGGGPVSKTESLAVEVLDDRVGIFVTVGSRSSVDQLGASIPGYAGSSSLSACSTPMTCKAVTSRL
jgi:hypothetical protein